MKSPEALRAQGIALRASEIEKRWLVVVFRSDSDVLRIDLAHGPLNVPVPSGQAYEGGEPTCRCYRCGVLLTARTVQVDRFGLLGIRPACEKCVNGSGVNVAGEGGS